MSYLIFLKLHIFLSLNIYSCLSPLLTSCLPHHMLFLLSCLYFIQFLHAHFHVLFFFFSPSCLHAHKIPFCPPIYYCRISCFFLTHTLPFKLPPFRQSCYLSTCFTLCFPFYLSTCFTLCFPFYLSTCFT